MAISRKAKQAQPAAPAAALPPPLPATGGGINDPEAWRALADSLRADPALKSQISAAENPGGSWIGDTYYAPGSQEDARAKLDDRYGSDMSWLDPSFQYTPGLLGESEASKVFADPAAQAAQWAALNRASQMTDTPMEFDTSGRQGEQYGNLQDIIKGGGATAIEMADRARQRADSESWLRGQREADMADYAERGLTGSGMELLSLSSDRQAAAGRNSLADLEMAKALEERRMNAINDAASLAGNMRNQTMQEQQAQRNAQQTALNSVNDMASNLRDTSFNEGQTRAEGADSFSLLNQNAINQAQSQNSQFMQNAYQQMMLQRQQWQQNLLNQGINVAQGIMSDDQQDAATGWNQATKLGASDANAYNNAKNSYNNALLGQFNTSQQQMQQAIQDRNNQMAYGLGQVGGEWANLMAQAAMGAGSAPTGGAAAGGGAMGGMGGAAGAIAGQAGQSGEKKQPSWMSWLN